MESILLQLHIGHKSGRVLARPRQVLVSGGVGFTIVNYNRVNGHRTRVIAHSPKTRLITLYSVHPHRRLNVRTCSIPFFSSLARLLRDKVSVSIMGIYAPGNLRTTVTVRTIRANYGIIVRGPVTLALTSTRGIICTSLGCHGRIFYIVRGHCSPPSI